MLLVSNMQHVIHSERRETLPRRCRDVGRGARTAKPESPAVRWASTEPALSQRRAPECAGKSDPSPVTCFWNALAESETPMPSEALRQKIASAQGPRKPAKIAKRRQTKMWPFLIGEKKCLQSGANAFRCTKAAGRLVKKVKRSCLSSFRRTPRSGSFLGEKLTFSERFQEVLSVFRLWSSEQQQCWLCTWVNRSDGFAFSATHFMRCVQDTRQCPRLLAALGRAGPRRRSLRMS